VNEEPTLLEAYFGALSLEAAATTDFEKAKAKLMLSMCEDLLPRDVAVVGRDVFAGLSVPK